MSNKIRALFNPEPSQWGLRGDPHLWRELKETTIHFSTDIASDAFEFLLDEAFNEIIVMYGSRITDETVWFEKFPQSGMSGGSISLVWWHEIGLPLLKQRYQLEK